MPSRAVDGGTEYSLLIQLYLHIQTPGDRFYNLKDDLLSLEQYQQSARDCIDEVQDAIATGCYHAQERTVEELVTGFKSHGPAKANLSTSSFKASQSSPKPALQLVQGSASSTPSEFCPSLESDHSGDGGDASNASLTSGGAPTTPAAAVAQESIHAPLLPQLPDPRIFASIRQVLSSNPSYAEDVICAVSQLPHDKRNFLFQSETECVDGSPSGPSKKRQRFSDENSNGSRSGGETGQGSGTGEGGGNIENGGDGDEGSGSGDPSPPNKKPNKDKNRRWICPYCYAYPHTFGIASFSSCWVGNMTEVHLWKSHLQKHHSPVAKNADHYAKDNAQLYMDSQQLDDVLAKIDSYKKRPRSLPEWHCYWKTLYLEVWYIIFPKGGPLGRPEPVSPFHLGNDEIANLGQQAKALLEPVYNAKASQAVRINAIASKEDFHPTRAETVEMMSDAIAIALLNSPAAIGATQWLAHASSQALQTAVAQYGDAAESQSGMGVTTPYGANGHGPAAPPDSATALRMPEFASISLNAVQAAPPILPTVSSFTSLPLFPYGLQAVMDLSSTNRNQLQTDNQAGHLQLTLPATFDVENMSQIPLPPLFMAPAMTTPDTPANVTQPAMDLTLDINWQPSTQPPVGQGVSMQTGQEKLSSQEESDLLQMGWQLHLEDGGLNDGEARVVAGVDEGFANGVDMMGGAFGLR